MNWYNDVKNFHVGADQRVGETPSLPGNYHDAERTLRRALLDEEFREYNDAEMQDDLVEIADALADMIYIICGTAVSYGIPLDKVFEEVHNSNMAKFVDGKVLRREDGKILKPDGWKPPDVKKIVFG